MCGNAKMLACCASELEAETGPTIGMTTDVYDILAGATEFLGCCEILPREIEFRMVSSLGEKSGALMEQFQGQEGELSLKSKPSLDQVYDNLDFYLSIHILIIDSRRYFCQLTFVVNIRRHMNGTRVHIQHGFLLFVLEVPGRMRGQVVHCMFDFFSRNYVQVVQVLVDHHLLGVNVLHVLKHT